MKVLQINAVNAIKSTGRTCLEMSNYLKAKGYTTYRIRQEKLIGQGTLTALKNGTGGLDSKTIARLCEVLDCQPGDLMEYVKASAEEAVQ